MLLWIESNIAGTVDANIIVFCVVGSLVFISLLMTTVEGCKGILFLLLLYLVKDTNG